MDNSFFSLVIQEIESVYGSLKLSADQKIGWYSRLKHFTEDEARLATHNLIKNGLKPSYQQLELELRRASNIINPKVNILSASYLVEMGRAAPFTDEKLAFSKAGMQGISKLMKMPKGKAKAEFAQKLKKDWLEGFLKLPDCTEQEDILQYAKNKDVAMLDILGVLNKNYPKDKPIIPMLVLERNYKSKNQKPDIEVNYYSEY